MNIRKIGAATLLSACLGIAQSACATDARELLILESADLAITPTHVGQVLTSPNKDFRLPSFGTHPVWTLDQRARRQATWVDRSYLSDPANALTVTTYFDFDEVAPLDTSAAMALVQPYVGHGFRFLVVGHADEKGSDAYNLALSNQRALSIQQQLIGRGVAVSDIDIEARGKTDPASFRDQSLNRRVELLVRGDARTKKAYAAHLGAVANREAIARKEREALQRNAEEIMRRESAPSTAPAQSSNPAATGTATMKGLLTPLRSGASGLEGEGVGTRQPLGGAGGPSQSQGVSSLFARPGADTRLAD